MEILSLFENPCGYLVTCLYSLRYQSENYTGSNFHSQDSGEILVKDWRNLNINSLIWWRNTRFQDSEKSINGYFKRYYEVFREFWNVSFYPKKVISNFEERDKILTKLVRQTHNTHGKQMIWIRRKFSAMRLIV